MTFLWWLGGLLIGMSILLGILIAASCALRSKRERTQQIEAESYETIPF